MFYVLKVTSYKEGFDFVFPPDQSQSQQSQSLTKSLQIRTLAQDLLVTSLLFLSPSFSFPPPIIIIIIMQTTTRVGRNKINKVIQFGVGGRPK